MKYQFHSFRISVSMHWARSGLVEGLTDRLLGLLVILVVASEERRPPDQDLSSGRLTIRVVPQLLGPLKTQLQGCQRRAHCSAVAAPGLCNERRAARLCQAVALQ